MFRQMLLGSLAALMFSRVFAAGIQGDTVNVSIYYPTAEVLNLNHGTKVIQAENTSFSESFFSPRLTTFINPESISIKFNYGLVNTEYYGVRVTNLSENFLGVYEADSATSAFGYGSTRYSTVGNIFEVNIGAGTVHPSGTILSFNLVPALAAVPEPET